jgi:hypothetical protein
MQTGSGFHSVIKWRLWRGWRVKLTTHIYIMTRISLSVTLSPLSLHALMVWHFTDRQSFIPLNLMSATKTCSIFTYTVIHVSYLPSMSDVFTAANIIYTLASPFLLAGSVLVPDPFHSKAMTDMFEQSYKVNVFCSHTLEVNMERMSA